jgi:phage shock protein E
MQERWNANMKVVIVGGVAGGATAAARIRSPGAINIANESIGTEDIPELPDKDQLILVYCRSGNRSKQASEKLVKLGYTNIVEIGGINSWPGETVAGDK